MTYYAHKPVAVLTYCFMASVTLPLTVQAKTTFLPDFEEEPIIFPGDCEGGGEDYCLCQRSANPKYHLSLDNPQCPSPKIFDKTCPHSDDWITECYCPATYNKICTSPYRGVGEICDGKYEECCDTRCREGTTVGCSYPYVTDYTSSTGCGETCYVCRYGNDCNTSCSADEITSPSGGYNDFNGQACVTCSTPPPPPPCTECWCDSSYCGPEPEPEPEPDPEEPDIPNIPVSPSCTLPDCKNTVSNKPSNSSYTTTSCTDCSGSHTINTGWSCNSGYEKSGNDCVEIKKTCTVQKCQYTTRPSGVNWICSACSGVNSDCSTYSGWNCYQLCDASDECAKYEPRCSIMDPGGCTWGIATTCKRYFSDCSVDTMVACCPR